MGHVICSGSLAGRRAVDIDNGRATSRAHDNEVALLGPGVALPMDSPPGDVEEVAGTSVNDLGTATARLHPQGAAHDIDRSFIVAVVMPSGHHVRLGPDQPSPQSVDGNGLLSDHARRRVADDPITRSHPTDGLGWVHDGLLTETIMHRGAHSMCVLAGSSSSPHPPRQATSRGKSVNPRPAAAEPRDLRRVIAGFSYGGRDRSVVLFDVDTDFYNIVVGAGDFDDTEQAAAAWRHRLADAAADARVQPVDHVDQLECLVHGTAITAPPSSAVPGRRVPRADLAVRNACRCG